MSWSRHTRIPSQVRQHHQENTTHVGTFFTTFHAMVQSIGSNSSPPSKKSSREPACGRVRDKHMIAPSITTDSVIHIERGAKVVCFDHFTLRQTLIIDTEHKQWHYFSGTHEGLSKRCDERSNFRIELAVDCTVFGS